MLGNTFFLIVYLHSFIHISWIPWNSSFRYIIFHEKITPNDAVTPQRQSQITPKLRANAVPRLLSSLVWIDQYYECNGMTTFVEFMNRISQKTNWPSTSKIHGKVIMSETLMYFPGQGQVVKVSFGISTVRSNSKVWLRPEI